MKRVWIAAVALVALAVAAFAFVESRRVALPNRVWCRTVNVGLRSKEILSDRFALAPDGESLGANWHGGRKCGSEFFPGRVAYFDPRTPSFARRLMEKLTGRSGDEYVQYRFGEASVVTETGRWQEYVREGSE